PHARIELLGGLLRDVCRGRLHVTSDTEDVRQIVIPPVTCVLVEQTLRPCHGNLCAPGSRPGCRVVDGECVPNRVSVDPREAFDDVQGFTGTLKVSLVGEVRGVDDERVALPMPTRIAGPLAQLLWQMRTRVQRDDADGVVAHLLVN